MKGVFIFDSPLSDKKLMISTVSLSGGLNALHPLMLTRVDRASGSMMTRPKAIIFIWMGPELFRLLLYFFIYLYNILRG